MHRSNTKVSTARYTPETVDPPHNEKESFLNLATVKSTEDSKLDPLYGMR